MICDIISLTTKKTKSRMVFPMNSIITQVAVKVVEEISKNIEKNGISEIGKTAEDILSILKEGTLELLSAAIHEMDSAILSAKRERKQDGITVKERNVPRTVITSIGELKYSRTYFEFKDGTKAYITDQLIGIEPFERLTKELCADLLHNTASMSMQKAVNVAGVDVSRQTVNNRLLSMKDVVTEITRESHTPSEIHIFADEDHVHLRPKQSGMVPLVTVTEGIDISNDKRHRTKSPLHFQGYGMEINAFIENVVAALYRKYDMSKVKRVVIHADGGNWIKKLGALMPESVFVMDGFHLEKYFKQLFRIQGASVYAGNLRRSVRENNIDAFTKYCTAIKKGQDEQGKKKLEQILNYFQNNWGSIVERVKGEHCGSCTEPLISHVLSERLSRNPIAWSKEGLSKMAMLRVYEENGGRVTAKSIRVSRRKADRENDYKSKRNGFEIYNKYADEQIKSVFGGNHDWSIFEGEGKNTGLCYGKVTGTTVMLRSFARLKAV